MFVLMTQGHFTKFEDETKEFNSYIELLTQLLEDTKREWYNFLMKDGRGGGEEQEF